MKNISKALAVLIGATSFAACGGGDSDQKTEPAVVIIDEDECTVNADCQDNANGPVCESNACVAGCLSDSDCTDGTKTTCTANVCVEPAVVEPEGCQSDADCEGDAGGPVCESSGECGPTVCATNEDCAGDEMGPVCDEGSCRAGCLADADCTEEGLPACNLESNTCEAPAKGYHIGTGDGGPGSVEIVSVYKPNQQLESPDLEFHPERNELWVVHRKPEVEGVCAQSNPRSARCASLNGLTTTITNPGSAFQQNEVLVDGNAWHFMRRPPAIAMGEGETFGTCGEARTGNFEDNDVDFIGPSLWSSDLSVYAQPSGGNGSHLDMLHATPFCMGMAHERENIYWVFNGNVGSIDRYDFHDDHGPGADDHSDGEIFRYVPGQVSRVPNVPSHMEFHDTDAHLYIADTGNARIVKLDTTKGMLGARFTPVYEPLANWGFMDGASMTEVVVGSGLVQPSGLAIHNETLYVSDHATGQFHAFDMEGNLLRSLDTGFGPGALSGLTIGPDDHLWFSSIKDGGVYRIKRK